MKNLSRVFLDRHSKKKKKILEETWRDWVLKFNSRLSFYYRLPAVEKCLDKSQGLSETLLGLVDAVFGEFRKENPYITNVYIY